MHLLMLSLLFDYIIITSHSTVPAMAGIRGRRGFYFLQGRRHGRYRQRMNQSTDTRQLPPGYNWSWFLCLVKVQPKRTDFIT